MPDDLMLAAAVVLLLVAGAVVVVGIVRVNVRLVVAGGAAAGVLWIACGWLDKEEEPATIRRLVILQVRAVDAAKGTLLPELVATTMARSEESEAAVYRLPASGQGSIVLVSLVAEWEIDGSLLDRMHNPDAHARLVDQTVTFDAPGYKPLRRQISQFVPDGWPSVKPVVSTTIELERP